MNRFRKKFIAFLTILIISVLVNGEEINLDKLSLTPPNGYGEPKTMTRSTGKMALVMGKLRKDGTQPSLFINVIDVTKFPEKRQARIPKDPLKNFDAFLGTISRRYKNFQHSKVKKVVIDGRDFANADWSGTINHPKAGSFSIKGSIYIHRDGDIVYQINYMDFANHADKSKATAKKAIEGCTFKTPKQTPSLKKSKAQ